MERNFTNFDRNASITSIVGNHKIFKHNSNVQGLFILKKEIFHLPNLIGENFFKNIAGITINDSKLKEIKSLKEFPKLREIYIVKNEIELLPSSTFESNQNLELIWIEGNKIVTIEAEIFDSLPQLSFLNIRERKSCLGVMKKIQHDRKEIEKFIEKVLKRKC